MELLGHGVLDWNRDGVVLSAEQRRFYEHNGYLIVKNCVSLQDLKRYEDRFNEICTQGRGMNPYLTIMRDVTLAKENIPLGANLVTKVQNFQDDPVLFEYCKHPAVVDVVKDLIGTPTSNLVAMHTMLINKPPDSGSGTSRHPLHQDQEYFPFGPADFICCAWTAMERMSAANGCLVVVPGTHKGELIPHEYPKWEGGVNKGYTGIRSFDQSIPRVHVEMEAGDTVFFHPVIIHGSGANKTNGFRKAISCHYANDDLCRYEEFKFEHQKEVSVEAIDMARVQMRKLGMDESEKIDYQDLWKVRARPVSGTKANL